MPLYWCNILTPRAIFHHILECSFYIVFEGYHVLCKSYHNRQFYDKNMTWFKCNNVIIANWVNTMNAKFASASLTLLQFWRDLGFRCLIRISPPYWLIFSSSNKTSSSPGLPEYCFCIKYNVEGDNAAMNTVLYHTFLGSYLWSLWDLALVAILCELHASSSTIEWKCVHKRRDLQLAKQASLQWKLWMHRIFPYTKLLHWKPEQHVNHHVERPWP